MFARKTIDAFGLDTQIISIDPQPRAEFDALCTEVVCVPFEDLPPSFIDAIGSDDLLFVDNSHRAFPNSDVTAFFLEVLPRLPAGTLYVLHDIFLPSDCPERWLHRHYSEQYLLAAYLLGGGDRDSILFPCQFVSRQGLDWPELRALTAEIGFSNTTRLGSCLWMTKG